MPVISPSPLRRLTSAATRAPGALPVALGGLALALLPLRAATAQEQLSGAAPMRGMAWRADSIAADGDTTRALAILDSVLRADPRNAPAWHRRGMIRWANARSKRSGGFIKDGQVIRWLTDADSSLRLARQFAPDSSRYAVDLGRFLLNSGTSTQRFAARGFMEKAYDAAQRTGTPYQVAEAADELGMTFWRHYENFAWRALGSAGGVNPSASTLDSLGANPSARNEASALVESSLRQVEGDDWMGRKDYDRAVELFEKAIERFPDHVGARRHYYMALAERNRWVELEDVANARVKAAKFDAPSLFAHGLALHRLNRGMEAQAAFDSALALLTDTERSRLTSLARILRTGARGKGLPSDSAAYASGDAASQAYTDSLYWQLADPLALTPENEHRNEFLARVAFAELRWTQDDFDLRGADSDRGEAWIRYGPPLRRIGLGSDGRMDGNSETWQYANGLSLTFSAPASFGTARYAGNSYSRIQQLKAVQPASWANVPIDRQIDSIRVQLARFRAVGDSADLVMVAEVPLDSLIAGIDVTRVPVDMGMGMWTGPSVVLLRDSTRVTVDKNDLVNAPRLRAWRERLPAGDHVYRFEALQPDGLRGARALGRVSLKRETGFGTSDLLAAQRVAPREGVAARRWRDLIVAPNAGIFRRGEPVGLVWETYGLQAAADGSAHYRVSVTLERRFENKASAFVANIVSGVAGAAGLSAKESKGRAAIRFDRSAPAGDAALDWLTLDVGNAAPGRYLVSVEVTDTESKKIATVSRMIEIR
jgi:GWxTD domain-containing protein